MTDIFEEAQSQIDSSLKNKRAGRPKKMVEEPKEEPKQEPEPQAEIEPTPIEMVKPVKKKVKRILTDEQKSKLKDNLARGRATALANRQKKAELKRLKTEADKEESDNILYNQLKEKKEKSRATDSYLTEIEVLKEQLAEERAKKKEEKKAVKVIDDPPSPPPRPQKREVKFVEEPKPQLPPPKKEVSNKDLIKMMKKLRC